MLQWLKAVGTDARCAGPRRGGGNVGGALHPLSLPPPMRAAPKSRAVPLTLLPFPSLLQALKAAGVDEVVLAINYQPKVRE